MALPNISSPTFSIKLPSTGKEIVFRPFLVKEEKSLLIAMESQDVDHMQRAMLEVLSQCIVSNDVSIEKLPLFDLEYLFLKIRAKSVSEKVTLNYRHVDNLNYNNEECDAVTPVEINLDEVEVKFKENHSTVIPLTDKLVLKMRYPSFVDANIGKEVDEIEIIAKCVESVYDDEDVYEPDDIDDAKKFIGSLNSQQFLKVMQFFETMPTVEHQVTYKCKGCGQEDTITLRGLSDFF